MPTSLVSTGITFPDGTTQTTAAAPSDSSGQRAIVGFGSSGSLVQTSTTNIINNFGDASTDVTGVGTARIQPGAASYGYDKALFAFGWIYGAGYPYTYYSISNLVTSYGVVATDTTGVGTAREMGAAASYGYDKAIFGFGYTAQGAGRVSMTNLVSNAGVVATDTAGVGTARDNIAATRYGSDKAIFAFGQTAYIESMSNKVSNVGVVATDTAGVGTQRINPYATTYGGDKAMFAFGFTGTSGQTYINLVSNTGVIASDVAYAVQSTYYEGASTGYGGDKGTFYGASGPHAVQYKITNTGVVGSQIYPTAGSARQGNAGAPIG